MRIFSICILAVYINSFSLKQHNDKLGGNNTHERG